MGRKLFLYLPAKQVMVLFQHPEIKQDMAQQNNTYKKHKIRYPFHNGKKQFEVEHGWFIGNGFEKL